MTVELCESYYWVDVDLQTAPGWRALYLTDTDPRGWFDVPMAGWLVQAETRHSNLQPNDPTRLTERPRRLVAAVVDDGLVTAATDDANFWLALGPGQPEPTPDEVADERRRRQQRRPGRLPPGATTSAAS